MHCSQGAAAGRQASSQQLLHLGLSWELQSAGRRHTAAVLATVMCMACPPVPYVPLTLHLPLLLCRLPLFPPPPPVVSVWREDDPYAEYSKAATSSLGGRGD